jgi:hypothetical protein
MVGADGSDNSCTLGRSRPFFSSRCHDGIDHVMHYSEIHRSDAEAVTCAIDAVSQWRDTSGMQDIAPPKLWPGRPCRPRRLPSHRTDPTP